MFINLFYALNYSALENKHISADWMKIGLEMRKVLALSFRTFELGCRHFEYLIRFLKLSRDK